MKGLSISDGLTLPLNFVTKTEAIIAQRGSGKTYLGSVMAEEMLKAELHLVFLDPLGVAWGLRSTANGKGPAYPILILGGEHGDLPLTPDMGKVVAAMVVEERISCIIDMSGFDSDADLRRFATPFAHEIFQRNRSPLKIMVDEADMFAPQNPMKGEEQMLHEMNKLVRRGRVKGIGMTMMTQRSAVLSKNLLTQVDTLIVMGTTAPQDSEVVDYWIKQNGTKELRDQVLSSLPGLPVGTAWVWSPRWLKTLKKIQVRRRETFDSSKTPEIGEDQTPPKTMADVDLESIGAKFKQAVDEQKKSDPGEIRKQHARLLREVEDLRHQLETQKPKVERVEVPVLSPDDISRLEEQAQKMIESSRTLLVASNEISQRISAANAMPLRRLAAPAPALPLPRGVDRRIPMPTKSAYTADVKLRQGERRILQIVAQHDPDPVSHSIIKTVTGYSKPATYDTYKATLKRFGFVTENGGGCLEITQIGMAFLDGDYPDMPRTTNELMEMWRKRLREGEFVILRFLVHESPRMFPADDLMTRTGYDNKSTMDTYLATLRRNGLIWKEGSSYRASDTLFPERR